MTAAGWNILLYAIAGDTAEHERVTGAIAHMRDALTTDRCNIAVQLHTKTRTTRHWISSGQKVHTEVLPAVVDASEPSSLTMFMNAAHRKLPATPTALLLWAHSSGLDHVHSYPKKAARQPGLDSVFGDHGDHGDHGAPVLGGAPDGELAGDAGIGHGRRGLRSRGRPERYGCRWGPDPNTLQYLTNVGMKKAIAQSAQKHVEILGLNACWMATLEVEYELRSVSDVQIASQVSAEPWPYGAIVAALAAAPDLTPERLARAIVHAVHTEIAAGKRHDTISALRSGPALDELASAFDAYAKRVKLLIDSDWESVAKAVMVEAQRVDDPYSVDLVSLIHHLGKHDLKSKIAAASVITKFDAMLLSHAASDAHPGVQGLSIFCPKSTHVDLADAYQGTEFRANSWGQFLRGFQARLARTPSA